MSRKNHRLTKLRKNQQKKKPDNFNKHTRRLESGEFVVSLPLVENRKTVTKTYKEAYVALCRGTLRS